ncbi:hypothetical protein BOVATA_043270 [Babesia ovata]|uniref:Uncharacterized protein n=1 Tax=Babesia ovata TaxID=189622 RepID=A0A2H6KIK9_9APIC|nr:uncharacterized protein BOVATA_043270 [Babesia ovata]GBE62834.1 hypothetical protein BOVATA_043270 [Babesia ovata]
MLHGTAQGDEMILDVIDVNVLYGNDVCGDFSEACFEITIIPWLVSFFKAMLSQLLELIGDVSVQLLLKLFKLFGDLGDALVYFTGLILQILLLRIKVTINFCEAFFIVFFFPVTAAKSSVPQILQ